MKIVRFNDALIMAARLTNGRKFSKPIRIIRDVYGKIRFAIDCKKEEFEEADLDFLRSGVKTFGAFASPGDIVFQDDFADPKRIFDSLDWHKVVINIAEFGEAEHEVELQLLDRQVVGQYWLDASTSDGQPKNVPPRVVFYGIKGGVGRSTALALFAYRLAHAGKNVLLLDFDLESPGLSGLLLPPERVGEYGIVDWFVEDAVDQADNMLSSLVVDSPLSDHTQGKIRVAPAMGLGETSYLSKLSRVYADVPRSGSTAEHFSARIRRLVRELEQREQPDVVLIDSRAGLHDLAAISIAGLSSLALLFATDTAQNWQGYGQLFAHWRSYPIVLRQVRERLVLVQALFPESDQVARSESFRQHAYDLFANNLYDQIAPVASAEEEAEAFSYSLDDEDAPHFPLQIRWNARLQEFSPLVAFEKGGASDAEVNAAFGRFFDAIEETIF
ncbi:ParA family protein [Herbaspirillum rubrisubalbicans]|uniref:ParA family protein n=1 Tax=Herbaspirillum rubrisubalbicans TaxID=80842 RepID=UPI0015C542B2|nr:ParA family protein [Herbaspirillum rubrisubalbicans]